MPIDQTSETVTTTSRTHVAAHLEHKEVGSADLAERHTGDAAIRFLGGSGAYTSKLIRQLCNTSLLRPIPYQILTSGPRALSHSAI